MIFGNQKNLNRSYSFPLILKQNHPKNRKPKKQPHICVCNFSVNFKKNERVYQPEKSEVLKALQENDADPEPGNENEHYKGNDNNVAQFVNEDSIEMDRDERLSHYYALACMLNLLNSGDSHGNIFSNDKLID